MAQYAPHRRSCEEQSCSLFSCCTTPSLPNCRFRNSSENRRTSPQFCAPSILCCCQRDSQRGNPASFGGSLLVRSGDLHFGPQVRVGVCAQAICAFELCSRKNSRKKYRKESCLLGSSTIRRRRNPGMAGSCYHLGADDFAQELRRSLSRWGASTINHPWHATCRTRPAGVVSITHGYGCP